MRRQAFRSFIRLSRSVDLTIAPLCGWTAVSNDSWITVTSGASGTGNGTVNYSVGANNSLNSRTGTMTIAGQTFTVTQQLLLRAVLQLGRSWATAGDR